MCLRYLCLCLYVNVHKCGHVWAILHTWRSKTISGITPCLKQSFSCLLPCSPTTSLVPVFSFLKVEACLYCVVLFLDRDSMEIKLHDRVMKLSLTEGLQGMPHRKILQRQTWWNIILTFYGEKIVLRINISEIKRSYRKVIHLEDHKVTVWSTLSGSSHFSHFFPRQTWKSLSHPLTRWLPVPGHRFCISSENWSLG